MGTDSPMMRQRGGYLYYEEGGFQALDLPYKGRQLSMLVVLGVVVAEAIRSGQPAWVLTGLMGPAVLAVATVRHWPRRFHR